MSAGPKAVSGLKGLFPHERWVSTGSWVEASVPCHGDFSMGLIKLPHNMAAGCALSERAKRKQGRSHPSPITQPWQPVSYWLHRSALLSVGGDPSWIPGLLRAGCDTPYCFQLGKWCMHNTENLKIEKPIQRTSLHNLMTRRTVLWTSWSVSCQLRKERGFLYTVVHTDMWTGHRTIILFHVACSFTWHQIRSTFDRQIFVILGFLS